MLYNIVREDCQRGARDRKEKKAIPKFLTWAQVYMVVPLVKVGMRREKIGW